MGPGISDCCKETPGDPKARRPRVTRSGMLLLISRLPKQKNSMYTLRPVGNRPRDNGKVTKDDF